VNTIIITILLVGFTCLQFTMVGLRLPLPQLPMYTYLNNEQLLHNLQRNADNNNTPENKKLVADINNACEQLKSIIIDRDINTASIPGDFEQKNIIISEKLMDLRDTYKTSHLLEGLKVAINAYNASTQNGKVPIDHSIVAIAPEQLGHATNMFILNSLTQLQINLAIAEQAKTTPPKMAVK